MKLIFQPLYQNCLFSLYYFYNNCSCDQRLLFTLYISHTLFTEYHSDLVTTEDVALPGALDHPSFYSFFNTDHNGVPVATEATKRNSNSEFS